MRLSPRSIVPFVASLALPLFACQQEELTREEARAALEESSVESQASSLTATSIELTTRFTIGKGVNEAAAELRTFVETELPCADVTIADKTLTITYGAKPGNCTYRGKTFTGTHAVTLEKTGDQAIVEHTWTKLSNGLVEVSGGATVTWDASEQTRRVQHDLTWTRTLDGYTAHGTGDRTQRPLAGGIEEGIQVDGDRSWEGRGKTWHLDIEGVQARWADAVPQAGTYRLEAPEGGVIEVSFARVSAEVIEVTLERGGRTFAFRVRTDTGLPVAGAASES